MNLTPVREARLVKDLQAKIFDLKQSLERAEHRLVQQQGRESSAAREVELEKELETANERFSALKSEKLLLEKSNKALRTQLTYLGINQEAKLTSDSTTDAAQVENAARKAERTRELEAQLIKAKKDKDKAIKLIILLIGKERISEFLQKNAGAADILDALVENFGGKVGASSFPRSPRSPPASPMNMKLGKKVQKVGGGGFMGSGPTLQGGDEKAYLAMLKSELQKK